MGRWHSFSRLPVAVAVGPALRRALTAMTYQHHEAGLVAAYQAVAENHNALGISEPQAPTVRHFHARPLMVIEADRVADACVAAISDDQLRTLPLVGSIDQWVNSTDVLSNGARTNRLIDWCSGLSEA